MTRRVMGFGAALLLSAAAMGQSLESKVRTAIANAKLGTAKVSVSVVDCASDRELVSISVNGADKGMIPASNLKLLTSGAALMALGPDYEFKTRLILDGDKLIVKGAGDPALADPELLDKMKISVDQFVDRLIDSIRKAAPDAKIREVVVDDRVFDREFVHPDWPKGQLHLAYCAQVGGVNFHANVLNVFVSPGPSIGSEPVAKPQPAGNWISIKRLAKTTGKGNSEVWLERDKEPFSFKLHGTVRAQPSGPIQVTVNNPGEFFGRVLADRVKAAGMGSAEGVSARLAGLDEQFGEGITAAIVRTPLKVALERCNVDSDNLYAESLVKLAGHVETGQPGSWANGTALVRMKLRDRLGPELASMLQMSDGCGLSRNNKVTATMLSRWLSEMTHEKGGEMFVASLALAKEEGTLKKRFKGAKLKNEVRGKSGYIREVRTLSGYVTNRETGKRAAFSVLVNDVPSGADARSKELHEKIVEIVDDWVASQPSRVAGERVGG